MKGPRPQPFKKSVRLPTRRTTESPSGAEAASPRGGRRRPQSVTLFSLVKVLFFYENNIKVDIQIVKSYKDVVTTLSA